MRCKRQWLSPMLTAGGLTATFNSLFERWLDYVGMCCQLLYSMVYYNNYIYSFFNLNVTIFTIIFEEDHAIVNMNEFPMFS